VPRGHEIYLEGPQANFHVGGYISQKYFPRWGAAALHVRKSWLNCIKYKSQKEA